MALRALAAELVKNGMGYRLAKRTKTVAMYSVQQGSGGPTVGYEVFLVKVEPAKVLFGKDVVEHERFPGNEDFGTIAWSWATIEQAEKCYNELIAQNA